MARVYKERVLLTSAQKRRAIALLNKRWQAHAAQREVLRAIYSEGYRCVFVQAGRKWGKNELANYLGTRVSIERDRAESYIIGSSAEAECKIIWNNERIQSFGPNFGQTVDNDKYKIMYPWGSLIQIDGCRNTEDGRGRSFDLVVFDEAKDQKRDYYDAAYPNLLAKDGILLVIGTPPDADDPDGDFYRELREEAKTNSDWKYFSFTSYDNPHISHEWLDKHRASYVRRGEEHIFYREYLVKDVSNPTGRVFPMFSEKNHCRHISVLLGELERGIKSGTVDFYAMSDPGQSVFCVLLCAYDKKTSQIYVLDEIYETNRYKTSATPMWNATTSRKKLLYPEMSLENWDDVYDEAASWYEVDVLGNFGVKLRPTNKKRGRGKETHVSLLKDAMSVPRSFQVADHCVNTIEELKRLKDINARIGNHSIDNIMYLIDECDYQYQNTTESIIVSKDHIALPRGVTLEQDATEWVRQEDPFNAVLDFDFDTDFYNDIFGV